ncbi:helix-turn-helix domain-containing protein [Streptomyces sp. NPDC088789]|uniref:helix-turn-helix domain-containing protein n=1 Tax=Streptomyces sp. NPDC088789 TaxID=3365899 RepID=UPI00381716C5
MFGAKMREHRGRAGMSLDALSGVVKISKAHLSRIEHAESPVPPELPAMLDAAFGTESVFTDLYALARKEVHPDKFRRRMELEARAVVIKEYSPQIVPGLIQTKRYARAQFEVHNPKATEHEIDDLVIGRMTRQDLLIGDPGPDYAVILDEAVLRRSYGGSDIMREQLARLLDLALTPSTYVQVLPFTHGGHALAGGSLSLWTLDDGALVAYEEAITTGTLVEENAEVQTRMRAYDLLSASALSPVESADMIRSVMEALPDEHHP